MQRSAVEKVYPAGVRASMAERTSRCRATLLGVGLASAGVACLPADPPEGPKRSERLEAQNSKRSASSDARRRTQPPSRRPALRTEGKPASQQPTAENATLGEVLRARFADDFERQALGPNYRPLSPAWRLSEGRLCAEGARNRPVWLVPRLPQNARIEFDAVSSSSDGDLKVELWGDGRSGATGVSYLNATSYLVIFGGWKNTLHVLARLNEHGADRVELRLDPGSEDPRNTPVEPGRSYHLKIERRDGKTVRWFVDDTLILSLSDLEPLSGLGHEHLAFNDWEAPVCFDNLDILPLDG